MLVYSWLHHAIPWDPVVLCSNIYWVDEHENGLCLDILSLLNMPGIDHVLFPNGDEIKEACELIRKIASKLNDENKLRESFKEFRNVDFGKKLSYAFRNPFLLVASLPSSLFCSACLYS